MSNKKCWRVSVTWSEHQDESTAPWVEVYGDNRGVAARRAWEAFHSAEPNTGNGAGCLIGLKPKVVSLHIESR